MVLHIIFSILVIGINCCGFIIFLSKLKRRSLVIVFSVLLIQILILIISDFSPHLNALKTLIYKITLVGFAIGFFLFLASSLNKYFEKKIRKPFFHVLMVFKIVRIMLAVVYLSLNIILLQLIWKTY